MNFTVLFSSIAELEIQDSFDWYEEAVSGLGDRFVDAIDKSINIILLTPKAFPAKRNGFREMNVDGFPFIILYEILDGYQAINVLHVFHTSRHPKFKYKRK